MLRTKQQGHQLTPGGFSLHTQPALSPVPLSGPVSLPRPSHTPLSFHPGLVPHSHHTCSPWASAPAIPTTWGLPPGSPNGGGGCCLSLPWKGGSSRQGAGPPLAAPRSHNTVHMPLTLHHGVPLNVLYRTQRPVFPGPPSAVRRPARGR